jgi:hypothetical protein
VLSSVSNRSDAPLAVFSTEDVHAYTCKPSVARQMVESDPSADVKQADTHRGRRRHAPPPRLIRDRPLL